jgi:hypothetical protein
MAYATDEKTMRAERTSAITRCRSIPAFDAEGK